MFPVSRLVVDPEHFLAGISSPYLKLDHAIVDPETTLTLPSGVIASTGFDELTHAVESYVARPFTSSDRPSNPSLRMGDQGATPYNTSGLSRLFVLAENTFCEQSIKIRMRKLGIN